MSPQHERPGPAVPGPNMSRVAVLAVVAAAAAGGLLTSASAALVDALSAPATVDQMIGAAAVGALGLVAAWIAAAILMAAVAELPGVTGRAASRVSATITPGVLRRMVALAVGVAVAGGTSPALASMTAGSGAAADLGATGAVDSSQRGRADGSVSRIGLHTGIGATSSHLSSSRARAHGLTVAAERTVALRPATRWAPGVDSPDLPSLDRPAGVADVLVRPGDSLWAIVGRHLGPDATDRAIATEWPRWYAANRAVIGDDPDLIHPGQHLVPPP